MIKNCAFLVLLGSPAWAAHPPYHCSLEEMRAVALREPLHSAIVSSGAIKSIVSVPGGYAIKTERCAAEVELTYLPNDGSVSEPCPSFDLRLLKRECVEI